MDCEVSLPFTFVRDFQGNIFMKAPQIHPEVTTGTIHPQPYPHPMPNLIPNQPTPATVCARNSMILCMCASWDMTKKTRTEKT